MPALIFDVDGTLAETEEHHRHAFNAAFAEAGLGWCWTVELYGRLLAVTGGKERIARYRRDEGLAPDAAAVAALHAAKTRHYLAALSRDGQALRPGVATLVREARMRGVDLAIATTTSRANVDGLLDRALGPDHGFTVIAAGDEVACKKPAPDIYVLALERLGLPASACLAIEDSRNGLAAARAAGLRCVVTPSLYTRDEEFSGAERVMDDLADWRAVLSLIGIGRD